MPQENVEILRRLYEHWARGDLSADSFDPDVEYSRIGAATPDMEGRWLGLDELAAAMRDYLRPFSDLRIEAERIIDLSEDRVLVLSRHTARGKQSGVPIEHENGDLFALRDGKIVRYDAYWNRAEALEAAGLSEEAMSQENLEIVRRVYQATNQGDYDSAESYLHPEIEFHTYAASPEAGVYCGKQAVREYNEALFGQFESIRFEVEEVLDGGDRVVVVSTQHAVPKGGRQAMDAHVAEVWTIRDGLLAKRHSYATKAEAVKAAGLSE